MGTVPRPALLPEKSAWAMAAGMVSGGTCASADVTVMVTVAPGASVPIVAVIPGQPSGPVTFAVVPRVVVQLDAVQTDGTTPENVEHSHTVSATSFAAGLVPVFVTSA